MNGNNSPIDQQQDCNFPFHFCIRFTFTKTNIYLFVPRLIAPPPPCIIMPFVRAVVNLKKKWERYIVFFYWNTSILLHFPKYPWYIISFLHILFLCFSKSNLRFLSILQIPIFFSSN
jgi:hypothetical protein